MTRCVRNRGVASASFDLEYAENVNPEKQNHMDLTTPAGYAYIGVALAIFSLFQFPSQASSN